MSKLQILIPQYNEDEALVKPLLDSIESQYDIDLKNDIEVFIGNDGSDTKLSVYFLKQYSFPIQYHYFEHSGLAATRQKLQDLTTADYIMFCDADDRFINNLALHFILSSIKDADVLVCTFLEEARYGDHQVTYVLHKKDAVFVHGKVYRRKYLEENQIKWHPELHEHQDSPFNSLAQLCSKKVKIFDMPIYLWHYNPNSICRKDVKYHIPNTWPHMIDSYDALVGDLRDRGMGDKASFYAVYCLYATYYEMSRDIWKEDLNEQKIAVYNRLRGFYLKYLLLIKNFNKELLPKVISMTQTITKRKGKINEMPPFEEWIGAILTIFKG